MSAHVAVLLAAGGSSRLGQSKQELTIQGEPLVRRMAQLLLRTKPARLYVVVSQPAVSAHLADLPIRLIQNPDWREGLSTSVRAVASALRDHDGPTLISGVDQCRLKFAHLQALLKAQDHHHDVVSRYDAENFGIPALVTAKTMRLASALRGDRGFGQLWRQHPERLLFVDAPELAFDLDTPDQLAMAIRRRWIDGRRLEKPTLSDEAQEKPALGVRELKQSRIRETVIAQAAHLFADRSYDETTVEDIAAAAGISTRTFFRHFTTKSDIVLAWMSEMTDFLQTSIENAPDDLTPDQALRQAFERMMRQAVLQEQEKLDFISLIKTSQALCGAALAKYAEWEGGITRGLEKRLPKTSSRQKTATLKARIGIALYRSALDEWLKKERREDFGKIFGQTAETAIS
ncbi:NTP transferase domain-containing protein [Kozakia baliensis]|uniref:NTP transferase domain-containing protein n=1 Tax=Kozakia baliensis TaxID=153496 RepID=UPI00089DC6BA|nr:NTP transferase domain-containing protein [Kozakia baliensis]GBR27557.1 hypothetical protein AA0488_1174 [Kozakia baliensis NRIC 0488]GEL64201.1 hypothetical protein KBA01_14870 [Kozakia baliensis]